MFKPFTQVYDVFLCEFRNVGIVYFEIERLLLKSASLARRALHLIHKALCPTSESFGWIFVVLVHNPVDHAFKLYTVVV